MVLFSGNFNIPGWMMPQGQTLNIEEYPNLEAMVGQEFGGGTGTFKLPTVTAMNGVNFLLQTSPLVETAVAPNISQIILWPGTTIPDGWYACNGQTLSIATHQDFYSMIGVQYGGDGRTIFKVDHPIRR